MIQELVFIIFLSVVPGLFYYMVDYGLGQPMSDKPSVGELFSIYSLFLAKRRLTKEELADLKRMYSYDEKEYKKNLLLMGRERFTWEKAAGMCVICSGFWASMVFAVTYYFLIDLNFIHSASLLLLTPIVSHLLLRKL